MDKQKQLQIAGDLIQSVGKDLLMKVAEGKVPEDWDGIELRQWIAEKFACQGTAKQVQAINNYPMLAGKRLKDYQNNVVCRNL